MHPILTRVVPDRIHIGLEAYHDQINQRHRATPPPRSLLPLPHNWDIAHVATVVLANPGRSFQFWVHCWQWLIRILSGMPTFHPLVKDFYTTEISRKVDFHEN